MVALTFHRMNPNGDELMAAQARLRARGNDTERRILEMVGEVLPAPRAQQRLRDPREIQNALSVELRGVGEAYPEVQFVDGALAAWVQPMRRNCPNGWSALAFLVARRDALSGRSHLDELTANNPEALRALLADVDAYIS